MRDSIAVTEPKLLAIDVVRSRSNESTESVDSPKSFRSNSRMTPPRHDINSWRTKDESSIFRSESSGAPDLCCIKRCLAFDDGD